MFGDSRSVKEETMTTLRKALAASALLSVAPMAATAAEDSAQESWIPGSFTANAAITSDYVFRGISQSNNNVAIQGGLDWDTGAGFHFGAWASSLNFKDNSEASAEVDLYGGYAGKIGEKLSYDVGFIYYWYPGAAGDLNYDLWEVYGKAAYDFGVAAVNFGVNYSPDNFGGTGNATYVSTSLAVPVAEMLSVSAGLNRYFLDQGRTTTPDYWDWNIGAKLNVNNWFNLDARYYDTDIAGNCLAPGGKHWCGSKGVVTISRSF
ncbi:MAG: TorF family putative porin [Rhodospirillaceae bacterium]